MITRRELIKKAIMMAAGLVFGHRVIANSKPIRKPAKEIQALVIRSVNGTPEKNILKVIELLGGIENIVGIDDVVILKPNLQWWNQGAPNILAFKTFVETVFNRPGGFDGEVIIAENTHRGASPWEHSGWSKEFIRNADCFDANNYNELTQNFKKVYGKKFSICHLINVGSGGKRVYSPKDGVGYVYCDGTGGVPLIKLDNGIRDAGNRSVIMTYPIFKTDNGTVVDFKNGIWENNSYSQKPTKFINFAALNHHSTYCGATSAIKNYLGISDLSGGPDPQNGGKLTKDYYNFHSFPFNKWTPGPIEGMLGAEIGVFMNNIRRADLNITTAEWIGMVTRTETPAACTKAVLASTDPVALDFHATKYILYPNSKIPIHNPENKKGPLYQYLSACAGHGGGVLDETSVAMKSFDCQKNRMQNDSELAIEGDITWGNDLKHLIKYLVLRSGARLLHTN